MRFKFGYNLADEFDVFPNFFNFAINIINVNDKEFYIFLGIQFKDRIRVH